jgi:outer membrane protein OmpA-like peptidoglycan-associated protein
VRKLAEVMAQNPDRTVLVEGFTDSTGSCRPQPGPVGAPRAIRGQALTGLGVPRERVAMRGYGEAYPGGRTTTPATAS